MGIGHLHSSTARILNEIPAVQMRFARLKLKGREFGPGTHDFQLFVAFNPQDPQHMANLRSVLKAAANLPRQFQGGFLEAIPEPGESIVNAVNRVHGKHSAAFPEIVYHSPRRDRGSKGPLRGVGHVVISSTKGELQSVSKGNPIVLKILVSALTRPAAAELVRLAMRKGVPVPLRERLKVDRNWIKKGK